MQKIDQSEGCVWTKIDAWVRDGERIADVEMSIKDGITRFRTSLSGGLVEEETLSALYRRVMPVSGSSDANIADLAKSAERLGAFGLTQSGYRGPQLTNAAAIISLMDLAIGLTGSLSVINLALNPGLILWLGPIGASVSLLVSTLVYHIIMWQRIKLHLGIDCAVLGCALPPAARGQMKISSQDVVAAPR